MDVDDISTPQRLEKQVNFMESNPPVGVCGTWAKIISKQTEENVLQYPLDHNTIVCQQFFSPALVHPSVMMRKNFLKAHDLHYSVEFPYAQDFDFWVRCSKHTRLANIGEVLLLLSQHDNQISRVKKTGQQLAAQKVRETQIRELGIIPSHDELAINEQITHNAWKPNRKFIKDVDSWLTKIIAANSKKPQYPEPHLSIVLSKKWYDTCIQATSLGLWTWKLFIQSPLSRYYKGGMKDKLTLGLRCLLRRGYWRPRIMPTDPT
jgi:hypothetical protein